MERRRLAGTQCKKAGKMPAVLTALSCKRTEDRRLQAGIFAAAREKKLEDSHPVYPTLFSHNALNPNTLHKINPTEFKRPYTGLALTGRISKCTEPLKGQSIGRRGRRRRGA